MGFLVTVVGKLSDFTLLRGLMSTNLQGLILVITQLIHYLITTMSHQATNMYVYI